MAPELLKRLKSLAGSFAARLRRPAPTPPELPPEPRPYPWEATYPDGIDWHAEIPVAPLTDILDRGVETWPDKPCLTFLGKSFTYAEVGDLVNRAARGFQDLGVAKGVRVGLFLPNSPYFIICSWAGAVTNL